MQLEATHCSKQSGLFLKSSYYGRTEMDLFFCVSAQHPGSEKVEILFHFFFFIPGIHTEEPLR